MNPRARISHHWAGEGSYHRRIAVGFLSVLGFVLVAKLVGAAKEVVLAWRYGTTEQVDAYVFLFNLITWPVAVWFSVLMVVLVPLVAHLRTQDAATLQQFLREFSGFNLVVAALATAVALLVLPQVVRHGSGLQGAALTQALAWSGPLSLLCGLGMVTALPSVLVLATGRHHISLLEAVPSLVLLGALLLPPRSLAEPLLWGSVAGFIAHWLCVTGLLYRHGGTVRPQLGFRAPAWRMLRTGIGIMLAAQALASSTLLVDQWLAAPLGPGAVSTLSYANRVLALLLGIGAMALGRAALPVLSQAHAAGDARVHDIAAQWVRWTLLAGAAMAMLAWPLAEPSVRMLFERGAFTAADTLAVAGALQFGMLQIPACFAALVLISYFSAQRRYAPLLLAGAVGLPAKIGAAWALVPALGLPGIMLSSVVFHAVGLALLIGLLRHNRGQQ